MVKKMKKKSLCTKQISIRCNEQQKNKLEKLSEERGMTQKDFILKCISDSVKKEKEETKKEVNIAACACYVQELVNYFGRNGNEDSYVEEVCGKLWDLVSLKR